MSGSGAPRRLPRAVRERQMLDAAVAVFSRRGYHTASMDEISEVAGVSKPMIYAYLGAKEDLFTDCIRREAGKLIGAIGDAVETGLAPEEQLWRGLRAFFAFVADHRDGWAVLYRQARAHGEPFAGQVEEMRTGVVSVVAMLLTRAVAVDGVRPYPAEEVTALAHALVGASESLADRLVDQPEESAEITAARLMNVVWNGFANLLNGQVWRPPPARLRR